MELSLRLTTSTGAKTLIVSSSDLRLSGGSNVERNRESCTLFVASYLALLSDSPISLKKKPLRLFKSFYRTLCGDLKGTVLSFASLAHQLMSQHMLMGTSSFVGDWIEEFKKTPVFFEYSRYFQSGDPSVLEYLYTFLNFGKKLDYDDEDFHATAFRGWMDVEKRLAGLVLDNTDVISLRQILTELLPDSAGYKLWPKHGPGRVSDRIMESVVAKHHALTFDYNIDRFFFRGSYGMYGSAEELGYSAAKVIPDPSLWEPKEMRPRIPARLRFVPKSLKVARSICMEPATMMFFQQAVARQLYEAIEDSQFARFIKHRDQTRNQRLALYGSYTASIDTLDLSSASDSLSYELVKQVFSPHWQIPLRVTRSSVVMLPDGDVFPIKKFAPMGSALCFPVQCLIFASVCIYAAFLYKRGLPVDKPAKMAYWDVFDTTNLISDRVRSYRKDARRLQPLAIYGDDICCDSRITPYVKSILGRLGFVVNEDKSFVGSQAFRESCGKYYLEGRDVTPLYYRVKGVRRRLTPSHIVSQVQLINRSKARGFHRLRSFLIYSMRGWDMPRKLGKFSVPFVLPNSTEFGIHSESPCNTHLDSRENTDYQRDEWKVWSISYERLYSSDFRHEKYSYMRWWATRHGERMVDVDEASTRHDVTAGCRVKWRWTPLY